MNTIPWLDHGTPARKGAVGTNKRQLLAEVARGMGIQAGHLAGVLLALDQGDGVVASRRKAIGIFESAAYPGTTVYGQVTLTVFAFNSSSIDYYIHKVEIYLLTFNK